VTTRVAAGYGRLAATFRRRERKKEGEKNIGQVVMTG